MKALLEGDIYLKLHTIQISMPEPKYWLLKSSIEMDFELSPTPSLLIKSFVECRFVFSFLWQQHNVTCL